MADPTPRTESQLDQSRIFRPEDAPVRKLPNGGQSWDIIHGKLPTGESVRVHESVQPAGAPPNPAHIIHHSELIAVIEGTLEFHHDNKVERVGPGGLLYVAYGTNHQVRNVGGTPARYVVVAIGGDIQK
ncbi:hypothetical protein GCM10011507_07990 [Edaphobacter acidisoli]|uniref:Cupin type-2 domain-containing protein n=1 Tax=Edaphobacter acidisoli TaxID=2040573 RepID=A0A916RKA1_9BACT|nr:cupin domain-containing protein [Edaphobacter acidisoli]GGA59018.1 hypothetical protein GCM10011507_07990 [Edaphobacter acidisoli]